MLTEKTFDANGVAIHYAEGSAVGPPLVLLHGVTAKWLWFLPLMPQLLSRYHVFALDLRGHGKSSHAPGSYTPANWADDVVAFLEAKISEPAAIFGHSLGGIVAFVVAARMGAKVRALVIGDSPMFWDGLQETEKKNQRAKNLAVQGEFLASKPIEEELFTRQMKSSNDVIWNRYVAQKLVQLDPAVCTDLSAFLGNKDRWHEEYDLNVLLPKIACPVLLIQADPELNAAMPDSDVDRARKLLPSMMHVKLRGMNHGLGMNTWEVAPILRALMLFLETV